MKKTIRLTESELHRIIRESVDSLMDAKQPLDEETTQKIQDLANKISTNAFMLNSIAVKCDLWDLARDTSDVYNKMKSLLKRIESSSKRNQEIEDVPQQGNWLGQD